MSDAFQGTSSIPVWHSWFRGKARTPRVRFETEPQEKRDKERRREDPRVPEIGGEGMFFIPETNEDDEDLTSLVPEFQGFTEMEIFWSSHNGAEDTKRQFNFRDETDEMEDLYYSEDGEARTDVDEACPEQSFSSYKKDYISFITITTKTEENEDYAQNRGTYYLN
ncbi:hypothetical protein Bca52824_017362 [Brassica carinata]|uniref:Uncharacterized protein n=1 Tax=Brassica carinata TaxID=52824 RepID=A0A8X7VMY8_BRACI|nr:hypothetical protein Bca52824_017362 [Brassica carinata]